MKTGEVEGAPICCMCGDHGVSSELFKCNRCGFRSQHKYCSNMYPGAQAYNICNWCLSKKDEQKGEEITNKSSQNSSQKATIDHDHDMKIKIKKRKIDTSDVERRTIDHNGIKKPSRFAAAPPPLAGRKRVTSDRGGGIAERIIKRDKSEEVSKSGIIIKPVFRNKVRRYKLLDEVSS